MLSEIAKSRDIPIKFDIIAVHGHPRSSILVSMESPYVTSYYSLTVTLDVSATVSEIFTFKARKSLNFPTPPFFQASTRGNPLEFGDGIWRQKTRITRWCRNHDASFLRFGRIPARDRQGGQTYRHVAIAITRAIASRG